LDIYLHFLILAERGGDAAAVRVRDAVSRLATYLAAIVRPSGSMPLLGDDDGGRLLTLDLRTAADARPALANAAVVTSRGDLAYVAGEASAELVWLLGSDAPDRFANLERRPPAFTSRAFDDGGTFALRDSWEYDANIMVFDAGPHDTLNCGHAHADALAFELTVGGRPVFVDAGTFAYVRDAGARNRFRSTAAHNTVTIDGLSSSETAGLFSWRHIARSQVRRWATSPHADYVHASHDGFERPPLRANHARRVLYVKPGYWLVSDSVTGTDGRVVDAWYHCAAGLSAAMVAPNEVGVADADQLVLRLVVLSDGGTLRVETGEVSPLYGMTVAAPVVRQRHVSRGLVRTTTLLARPQEGVETIERISQADVDAILLTRADEIDTLWFGSGGSIQVGDLVSDAEALWIRRDRATGRVRAWMVVAARELRVADEALHASAVAQDAWSERILAVTTRGGL
jgi:hypothetical protein